MASVLHPIEQCSNPLLHQHLLLLLLPATAASPYTISEFRLVNADTDGDGETLILDELGFNWAVRAVAFDATWYVIFYVNGQYFSSDFSEPFALCTNLLGDNVACSNNIGTGTYIFSAVPYYFTEPYPYLSITITIQQSARRELAPRAEEETDRTLSFGQKFPPKQQRASVEVGQNAARLQLNSLPSSRNGINPTTTSTSEPRMDGVDESEYYCSAEDFPCKGDDMVYICIYSSYKGYQTLCIPEIKSDILSYYDKSYCGECVGGFGAFFRNA